MIKTNIILGLLLMSVVRLYGQETHEYAGKGNLKYVDPLIGNVGQLLEPTRPTVQLPNQMMRMFPERSNYLSDQISSFPLLVVSHRLGEAFSMKPSVKDVNLAGWNELMTYDHDLEITRPWYYSTYLIDNDIKVEFTPGKKAAIYKFEFPKNSEKHILFDLYNEGVGSWKFVSGKELYATETYHGDIKVYLYGVFSTAGKVVTVQDKHISESSTVEGKGVKSEISFPESAPGSIEFRYAVSYISPAQARKNFDSELTDTKFSGLMASAEEAWSKNINQIQVEGGTESQKRSFYTALYRSQERMVDITEDHQYYSVFSKRGLPIVYTGKPGVTG